MNPRLIFLIGTALCVGTLVALWFMAQAPEELSAWLGDLNAAPEPVYAPATPRPRPKRDGPCRGMTWRLLGQEKFTAQVGADSTSNWQHGDTPCSAVLSILCSRTGELGVTSPVPGHVLASLQLGDALCASRLGAGWHWLDVSRDGASGLTGRGELPANVRFWVANQGAQANPWD